MRHLLVVKFKSDAVATQIDEALLYFKRIQNDIPGIVSVEYGSNESPEGLDKGYTHVVLMTFDNAEARDTYLPHPAHEALKQAFVPLVDDIIVLDYLP